jgi:hypothetical protein
MPQKDTVRRLIDAPLPSDLRTEAPKRDGPAEAGTAYHAQTTVLVDPSFDDARRRSNRSQTSWHL